MAKFVCKSCNYRFQTSSDMAVVKCPYCGKFDAVPEPSAEDILKDVD